MIEPCTVTIDSAGVKIFDPFALFIFMLFYFATYIRVVYLLLPCGKRKMHMIYRSRIKHAF